MGLNDEDDDLTNLTWLQDGNLLQHMSVENKEYQNDIYPSSCQGFPDENIYPNQDNETVSYSIPPVPYNPHIHIHAKPPYSFSSLIFMAIESSENKALPVKDIYSWIVDHFPYYKSLSSGWKNTVRHNLSLNKCFRKVDKGKEEDISPLVGKGSLWCVDPNLRPNLLQAVRRTSNHIYPYMSTTKMQQNNLLWIDSISSKQPAKKIRSVDHMPHLSSPLLPKRLLIPIINRESKEADAAESMLTLTRYNSDDNTLLILENKSEAQESLPSKELSHNPTMDHNYFSPVDGSKRKIDDNENDEDDDGLKGAQALLNLASRNRSPPKKNRTKE